MKAKLVRGGEGVWNPRLKAMEFWLTPVQVERLTRRLVEYEEMKRLEYENARKVKE